MKHTCGLVTTQPNFNGTWIGQYFFSSILPLQYWYNYLPGNFILVRYLTQHAVFSNLFFKNKIKFATANGTFCQVLEYFEDFNLIKFILPSKKVKIISGWSFVFLGRNSQIDYKYSVFAKAGSLFEFGKKSKTRGVARNPVDHPHGGRTKVNKPEVSIWGWVAKRNK